MLRAAPLWSRPAGAALAVLVALVLTTAVDAGAAGTAREVAIPRRVVPWTEALDAEYKKHMMRQMSEVVPSDDGVGKCYRPNSASGKSVLSSPFYKRIVVIGDIHGDIRALARALELGGVVQQSRSRDGSRTMVLADEEIVRRTLVVQTGDIMDRGEYDLEAIGWLDILEAQGLNIARVLGNHETMNAIQDYTYFNRGGTPELLERIHKSMSTCGGNLFKRFHEQVAALVVTSPNQDARLVFSHGGISPGLMKKTIKSYESGGSDDSSEDGSSTSGSSTSGDAEDDDVDIDDGDDDEIYLSLEEESGSGVNVESAAMSRGSSGSDSSSGDSSDRISVSRAEQNSRLVALINIINQKVRRDLETSCARRGFDNGSSTSSSERSSEFALAPVRATREHINKGTAMTGKMRGHGKNRNKRHIKRLKRKADKYIFKCSSDDDTTDKCISPVWYRGFTQSGDKAPKAAVRCLSVSENLRVMRAAGAAPPDPFVEDDTRYIMGHSIQHPEEVTAYCKGAAFGIDVSMSYAFHNGAEGPLGIMVIEDWQTTPKYFRLGLTERYKPSCDMLGVTGKWASAFQTHPDVCEPAIRTGAESKEAKMAPNRSDFMQRLIVPSPCPLG